LGTAKAGWNGGRHRRRRRQRRRVDVARWKVPRDNDIRICRLFDDRAGDRSPPIVQGYPRLGTTAELVEFGRIAKIDMLSLAADTAENRLLRS